MMDDETKLDEAKVQALTKQYNKLYGETVLTMDNCNSPEERKAVLQHNEYAKVTHAERREKERFEEPSLYAKFKTGIKKLFGLNQAKQNQIEQKQQHTR